MFKIWGKSIRKIWIESAEEREREGKGNVDIFCEGEEVLVEASCICDLRHHVGGNKKKYGKEWERINEVGMGVGVRGLDGQWAWVYEVKGHSTPSLWVQGCQGCPHQEDICWECEMEFKSEIESVSIRAFPVRPGWGPKALLFWEKTVVCSRVQGHQTRVVSVRITVLLASLMEGSQNSIVWHNGNVVLRWSWIGGGTWAQGLRSLCDAVIWAWP